MKDTALNEGHLLELQDRLNLVVEFLQMLLAEHLLVENVGEFNQVVSDVLDQLADLYQVVGQYKSISDLSLNY